MKNHCLLHFQSCLVRRRQPEGLSQGDRRTVWPSAHPLPVPLTSLCLWIAGCNTPTPGPGLPRGPLCTMFWARWGVGGGGQDKEELSYPYPRAGEGHVQENRGSAWRGLLGEEGLRAQGREGVSRRRRRGPERRAVSSRGADSLPIFLLGCLSPSECHEFSVYVLGLS